MNKADPTGTLHVPIGLVNTSDHLKTFVEKEGVFSPGFGTCGIYFWVYDKNSGKLNVPLAANCQNRLSRNGQPLPVIEWEADGVLVKLEICETAKSYQHQNAYLTASRMTLTNPQKHARPLLLFAALRPLGAAGGAVRKLSVCPEGDALLQDGNTALLGIQAPTAAGVTDIDAVFEAAVAGQVPPLREAVSQTGECSGALAYDFRLEGAAVAKFEFICPVKPGKRAFAHEWTPVNDFMDDKTDMDSISQGALQPAPARSFYRKLVVSDLFSQASEYWHKIVNRVNVETPDPKWNECFAALTAHSALTLNNGSPDVAVINYNAFNRDALYMASLFQKSGNFDLSAQVIDYMLQHPFSGRPYPEADNPGQVLWSVVQHWLFTRDQTWLRQKYSFIRKLTALIRYIRKPEGALWVNMNSLEFGDALKEGNRQELKPGKCDGFHPEYTGAYDIAGLHAAVLAAEALHEKEDGADWQMLADELFKAYDQKFGNDLANAYGSYCVLWPCRLYALETGKAAEQFKAKGAQGFGGWRYFPVATAHQSLLAGNRSAGHGTIDNVLSVDTMQGWYVADEGPFSGEGLWKNVRSKWQTNRAMPHGWAIAEVFHLLRDSLAFEDGDRIVLFSGIPEAWLLQGSGIRLTDFPTHFGFLNLSYQPTSDGARLRIKETCTPPKGFVLKMPHPFKGKITVISGAKVVCQGQ